MIAFCMSEICHRRLMILGTLFIAVAFVGPLRDPVKNISDIRKVELTIKNGNLYDPRTLYQSYGFGFWK